MNEVRELVKEYRKLEGESKRAQEKLDWAANRRDRILEALCQSSDLEDDLAVCHIGKDLLIIERPKFGSKATIRVSGRV